MRSSGVFYRHASGEPTVVEDGDDFERAFFGQFAFHVLDQDLILVQEEFVDFDGAVSTKDVEMRIRKSQGG